MERLTHWFRVWFEVWRSRLVRLGHLARATWGVFAASLVVTTDEVKVYLKEYPEAFTIREQVKLRSIVIQDGPGAEALAAEVARRATGESFSKLSRAHETNPDVRAVGGVIGWVGRGEPAGSEYAEIESALFALRPGEVAGPFRTSLGLHVVKCDGHREPRQRTFREAKPFVKWWLYVNRATLGAQPAAKGA